jgi:hypothetical protein
MKLSEEKKQTEEPIPDNIRVKVSSFPSMPQAAVKLRSVLKEDDALHIKLQIFYVKIQVFQPIFLD